MGQVDLSDYKNIYLQTAKEYVDSLLVGCDRLASDSQDKDAVNQIHISSHSLKSQSQVMGFTDIVNICLNIENKSNDILNRIGRVDNVFLLLLRKAIDELSLKLAEIEKEV